MSRCFPYPPPGYTRTGARVEPALIESIKLQSEREKCKTDSKREKSREKKQKRKEHKDKSHRHSPNGIDEVERKRSRKELKLQKGAKHEIEQIEKSGLTEEHGQPVRPQSPAYLSDGTQNSQKTKRDPQEASQPNKPGPVIRIKLTLRKPQDSDSSLGKEQTCSTSGRDNFLPQKGEKHVHKKLRFTHSDPVTSIKDATKEAKNVKPVSSEVNNLQSGDITLPRFRNSSKSTYEYLFEKWVPSTLELEQGFDDEWLFGTRQPKKETVKMPNIVDSQVPSFRNPTLWPAAQYLPDADIYSLPYTIPF